MSDKMIEIQGKQISEDTIVEALQKHCGFEEKPYVFKEGDVVENGIGELRIICQDRKSNNVMSINVYGGVESHSQSQFENCSYKKIGVLSDYIKK